MPRLIATAWTSAGNTSPLNTPATSPVPIAQRVAAVAEAGYIGLGLIADDLAVVRETIGFDGLRALMADHELTHIEIELIERWWIPRGEPGHTYETRDLLMAAADALAPAFIKIGSQNGPPIADPLTLVGPLRDLADEAAAHGTKVAIETMPFSAIATVPMGIEIIDAADHPAAGLIIDAWHVFRAGTPLSDLGAALKPQHVFGVELDDAAEDVVGTLFEDTVERRLLCGEGSFDLPGLIGVLRNKGFDGPWGVEILSTSFRQLPILEALGSAARTALKVL
ncbi:sugar phosphate isomerase/epimerase [Mycolicibacterium moriokaense]|nr:sugar phosphate isomerase/epimerase [Mycolicibacterium moriokaense]